MTNFKPYKAEILQEKNIKIKFFEHEEKNIMLAQLIGTLPEGSKGGQDCDYIKQQLTINLFAMHPTLLLLDLSQMKYIFGNSLIDAFSPLWELQIFDNKFKVAYLLSDINKYGFASLWGFDIDNPPKNIFLSYEKALRYLEAEYEL